MIKKQSQGQCPFCDSSCVFRAECGYDAERSEFETEEHE